METMDCVDLGLSVKWATCNVGANKPEEYGGYYAWGETATKEDYGSTYKYFKEDKDGLFGMITKYCTIEKYGIVDNKTVLEKSDDVAYTTLGGKWRTPTDEEWDELKEKCTWTKTTIHGVDGYKIETSNGNFIFLPEAGYKIGSKMSEGGYYWSSSLFENDPRDALYTYFYGEKISKDFNCRCGGRSVRPVMDDK